MAPDFGKFTTEEIEDIVIEGTRLTELYRLDIYLERKRSGLFKELSHTGKETERIAIKNSLSWAENILQILKKRQDDLREGNNTFNWRFRTEAQKFLPPETYNQIAESAKRS